jgi:S-adenosylmethionine decarboxylase
MSDPVSQDATNVVGVHLFADLYGVDPQLLIGETRLLDLLLRAVRTAGFKIVGQLSYKFPGDHSGVTAIALLSESHAAFHTYPEHRYVALDVFSCGGASPEKALDVVVKALQPEHVDASTRQRATALQLQSLRVDD